MKRTKEVERLEFPGVREFVIDSEQLAAAGILSVCLKCELEVFRLRGASKKKPPAINASRRKYVLRPLKSERYEHDLETTWKRGPSRNKVVEIPHMFGIFRQWRLETSCWPIGIFLPVVPIGGGKPKLLYASMKFDGISVRAAGDKEYKHGKGTSFLFAA